jgi:hypothetical protein
MVVTTFYKVDYYQESPRENPRGPNTGEKMVLRGGAFQIQLPKTAAPDTGYNESPGSADICFGYDIYGFRLREEIPAPPASSSFRYAVKLALRSSTY